MHACIIDDKAGPVCPGCALQIGYVSKVPLSSWGLYLASYLINLNIEFSA